MVADDGTCQGKLQLLSFWKACDRGRAVMWFAGVDRLQKGKAKHKYKALRYRMVKDGVAPQKLICFGSDGAGTFSGRVKGVVALLMKLIPLLLAIHCVLHRIPLGTENSTKSVMYLHKQFFNIIEHLGRYYRDSPKRASILEKIQLRILKRTLKIICSGFTRWLTHDGVTSSIDQSLVPCLMELKKSSHSDATSLGLFTLVKRYEFIGFLKICRDVLPVVAKLSRGWQANATDFGRVKLQLDSTCDTLELWIDQPILCTNYQTLDKTIREVTRRVDVTHTADRTRDWLERSRRAWLRALVDNLRARLPHPELLVALHTLFDPQQYPAGTIVCMIWMFEYVVSAKFRRHARLTISGMLC
jgi:hypothetical protein